MNGTISRILKFCGRYFTSVFCSLFLHTFGLISRRNRELMTTVNRHFGFSASGEKAPVPSVIQTVQGLRGRSAAQNSGMAR